NMGTSSVSERFSAAGGQTLKAGFVGLGVMGRPMARHLIDAGFALTVASRSRGPIDELVNAGAREAATPAEVARASDVVILMLPDPPDVEAVIFGSGGLVEGLAP